MHKSKISVVICTRNRAEVLAECLQSIANNKLRPFEILVVDQSTNDSTADVVREFSATVPCAVRYLHHGYQGLTKARNIGLKASTGDIVAFTDDDCIADPGWLEAIAREFRDPRISCVCGQTRPVHCWGRPKTAMLSTLNHSGRRVVRGKHNPLMLGRGNNMAFRRVDLMKLGGFNECIGVGQPINAGDDSDVLYRFLESGRYVVHTPDAVVLHRQPADWRRVLEKKHGYSASAAAILCARLRYGDIYAGMLLAGKIAYEFCWLFLGGIIRMNLMHASVGWHSFTGSLSGLGCFFKKDFCREVRRLTMLARERDVRRDTIAQPIRHRTS